MQYYEGFAERFSLACKDRFTGMNQGQIGKRLGVSNVTVSNWMNGHKLPSSARMADVAQRLGVSADWLATGRGSMRPHTEDNIVDIGDLPPEFRRSVRDLIDTYRRTSR